MAEAAVFETGRLTDVWNPVGRDTNGNLRYRRANFDLLTWSPAIGSAVETYVVPLGLERSNGADVALKSDGSGHIGQEFGYYSSDSLIVEPYQGDGMSDAVQALHSFGFV